MGPMLCLVSILFYPRGAGHGCTILRLEDVESGFWEVTQTTRMIDVEVRDENVADVIGGKTEPLHLTESRFIRRKSRSHHPYEGCSQSSRRVLEVIEPDTRVDEDQALFSLDEQAMAGHFGLLPLPGPDQRSAVWAHGAAVEMVCFHRPSMTRLC